MTPPSFESEERDQVPRGKRRTLPTPARDALEYHAEGRPGKIEVVPSKAVATQRDLSLAYTPGVAEPCRAIHRDPEEVFRYTARGNLVAVVSNGTAVLGLANIGPLASKPVMEGKGVLFKRFAGIDVFDLEIDTEDPDEIVRFCQLLEPTVGGINLEDIRAPECFHVEEKLRETMGIPVFHDDQHGTAIIAGAALINALELSGRSPESAQVVFSGAGASALATAGHFLRLGVRPEHLLMADRAGVIHQGPRGGDEPLQGEVRHCPPRADPGRCDGGGRRGGRPLRAGSDHQGDGRFDGAEPGHLRPGPTPTPRSRRRRWPASGATRSWPRAAPTIRIK